MLDVTRKLPALSLFALGAATVDNPNQLFAHLERAGSWNPVFFDPAAFHQARRLLGRLGVDTVGFRVSPFLMNESCISFDDGGIPDFYDGMQSLFQNGMLKGAAEFFNTNGNDDKADCFWSWHILFSSDLDDVHASVDHLSKKPSVLGLKSVAESSDATQNVEGWNSLFQEVVNIYREIQRAPSSDSQESNRRFGALDTFLAAQFTLLRTTPLLCLIERPHYIVRVEDGPHVQGPEERFYQDLRNTHEVVLNAPQWLVRKEQDVWDYVTKQWLDDRYRLIEAFYSDQSPLTCFTDLLNTLLKERDRAQMHLRMDDEDIAATIKIPSLDARGSDEFERAYVEVETALQGGQFDLKGIFENLKKLNAQYPDSLAIHDLVARVASKQQRLTAWSPK